jgi:hypothetical protein
MTMLFAFSLKVANVLTCTSSYLATIADRFYR